MRWWGRSFLTWEGRAGFVLEGVEEPLSDTVRLYSDLFALIKSVGLSTALSRPPAALRSFIRQVGWDGMSGKVFDFHLQKDLGGRMGVRARASVSGWDTDTFTFAVRTFSM